MPDALSEAGNESNDEPKTRVRVTKACNLCFKHRVRCVIPEQQQQQQQQLQSPGEAPIAIVCERCARLKLTCDFNREQKKRGPKAGGPSDGATNKRKKTSYSGASSSKLRQKYDGGNSDEEDEVGDSEEDYDPNHHHHRQIHHPEKAQLLQRNQLLEHMLRKVLLQQAPESMTDPGSADVVALGMELLNNSTTTATTTTTPSIPTTNPMSGFNGRGIKQESIAQPGFAGFLGPHQPQPPSSYPPRGFPPPLPQSTPYFMHGMLPTHPNIPDYGYANMPAYIPTPGHFTGAGTGASPGPQQGWLPPPPPSSSPRSTTAHSLSMPLARTTSFFNEASSEEAARTMTSLAHAGRHNMHSAFAGGNESTSSNSNSLGLPRTASTSSSLPTPSLTTSALASTTGGSTTTANSFDFSPDRLPSPQMTVAIYSRFLQVTSKQNALPFPVLHSQSLLSNPFQCLPLAHAILGASFRSPAFYAAAREAIYASLADRFRTPSPEILVASYITFFDMMSTGYDYRFSARVMAITRMMGLEIIMIDKALRENGTEEREGEQMPSGAKLLTGIQRETVRRAMWGLYIVDKIMSEVAHRPPIVTERDMLDVALPVPDTVWTGPIHDYDASLEEQRWNRAKQLSGEEFFAWKGIKGKLQIMAPSMTPLHHHILIANLNEWVDGFLIFQNDGGLSTLQTRSRIASCLEDYYAVFVRPFATPVDRGVDNNGTYSADISTETGDFVLGAPRNNGLATTMMMFYNYFQIHLHSPTASPAVYNSDEWYLSPDFPIALQHAFSNSVLLEQTMVWDPELESLDPTVLKPITQATACYVGLMKKLSMSTPGTSSGSELALVKRRISVTLEAARKLSRFMVSSRQMIVIMERLLGEDVFGNNTATPGSGSVGGGSGVSPELAFSLLNTTPSGPPSTRAKPSESNPWLEKFMMSHYFGLPASARTEDVNIF